jgi:PhzF family phenazine biosynthesis protein
MEVDYLHISAFTSEPGKGNSAAVCRFDAWPSDEQLSALAQKIGLPVTACLVSAGDKTELRWLSRSGTYVQSMCGHGTLAASCVVAMEQPGLRDFEFHTPGGKVPVRRAGDLFFLALPRWNSRQVEQAPALAEALGGTPSEFYDAGRDMVAVYRTEAEVRALAPNMAKLRALGRRGFIATAPGMEYDCVSRFFCPSFGIGVDEDPVTGSAHCSIAPLWADKLGKQQLQAYQASAVGGVLQCRVTPESVVIGAPAVLFKRGHVAL